VKRLREAPPRTFGSDPARRAGNAHALRGLASPIAFCDIEPDARQVLEHHMRSGTFAEAPVFHDVRELRQTHLQGKRVDLITAGFPCVGFSSLGLLEGFADAQSGLYSEVLRLVSEIMPPLCFLENVPGIRSMGLAQIIRDFTTRGYDLRWCEASGYHVGAMHERKRFFGLAIRRDEGGPGELPRAAELLEAAAEAAGEGRGAWELHDWSSGEPARLSLDTLSRKKRCKLLGNAVIPDAVRAAFLWLASGGVRSSHLEFRDDLVSRGSVARSAPLPPAGWAAKGRTWNVRALDHSRNWPLEPVGPSRGEIILDPSRFVSDRAPSTQLTTQIISQPVSVRSWSTPRHGLISATNFLTVRSMRDLPSQVRWASDTEPLPDGRVGQVSGDWVDWLMGFPIGHTAAFPHLEHTTPQEGARRTHGSRQAMPAGRGRKRTLSLASGKRAGGRQEGRTVPRGWEIEHADAPGALACPRCHCAIGVNIYVVKDRKTGEVKRRRPAARVESAGKSGGKRAGGAQEEAPDPASDSSDSSDSSDVVEVDL